MNEEFLTTTGGGSISSIDLRYMYIAPPIPADSIFPGIPMLFSKKIQESIVGCNRRKRKTMTNTKRKLGEAKFFLDQLNPNDPFFDYILSAYLNAARSTTWVMRNEFQHVTGWEDWFNSVEITEKDKKLLKEINELRILSTKKSGIKTDYFFMECIIPDENYYSVIKAMLEDLKGEEIEVTISSKIEEKEMEEGEYRIRGTVKLDPSDPESSREGILKLCTDYLKFLDSVVSTCVERFQALL